MDHHRYASSQDEMREADFVPPISTKLASGSFSDSHPVNAKKRKRKKKNLECPRTPSVSSIVIQLLRLYLLFGAAAAEGLSEGKRALRGAVQLSLMEPYYRTYVSRRMAVRL